MEKHGEEEGRVREAKELFNGHSLSACLENTSAREALSVLGRSLVA